MLCITSNQSFLLGDSVLSHFLVTLILILFWCVLQKCEFNMDNLSKPELLTLLSIMEGELEARDLVIEALRVSPSTDISAAAGRTSASRRLRLRALA